MNARKSSTEFKYLEDVLEEGTGAIGQFTNSEEKVLCIELSSPKANCFIDIEIVDEADRWLLRDIIEEGCAVATNKGFLNIEGELHEMKNMLDEVQGYSYVNKCEDPCVTNIAVQGDKINETTLRTNFEDMVQEMKANKFL